MYVFPIIFLQLQEQIRNVTTIKITNNIFNLGFADLFIIVVSQI